MNGFAASPVTIAIALAIAGLIAVVGGLGIGRGGAGRRGWRAAALAAALLGLLGLVLRPWRAAVPPDDRAVLLTAGAAGAGDGLRVSAAGGGRWRWLPDARTLWRNEPGLRRLEVRGYGLTEEDFDGFRGTVERFDPPPLPPGVTAAAWPRRLALGASLRVEARVSPATVGRLELQGPGGVEAEVDAAAARRGVMLTTVPKAAGRLLYRLVVRGLDSRELASEPLDVTVEPERPPAVLALFGAPSFETRTLLRWLAASGVPFVARQELTRGRSRVAALWPRAFGPQPPASPLAAASLARFDAVLADGRSFQALPARERAALASAIEAGLGLLLLDVDAAAGEERGLPLQSRPATGGKRGVPGGEAVIHEARLRWPGEEPLPALAVPGREIAPRAEVEPLANDGERHVLAARVPRGRGWIALSLIAASHPLRLDAGERGYGALWAHLLGAVARPDPASRFELPWGPVLVNRPIDAELIVPGGTPAPLEMMAGGQSSTLPAFASGRGRLTARLWPRRAGWTRLSAASGAAAWVYASGAGSWDTWRKAARTAATRARASGRTAAGAAPAPPARRPWPRLPLYALFLGGAALLWLLERVRPSRSR